jgi:aryl-alcohol dehydrogenase-like predicted oxidoreductase
MQYRTLGRTGIKVTPYCLGAMMFGAAGNPDHDDSIRIIHRALDAGINFIDTADAYSRGESEEIVGKADRERLSISTICSRAPRSSWMIGFSTGSTRSSRRAPMSDHSAEPTTHRQSRR